MTIEATLTSDAKLKADYTGGLDLATQDTKANVTLTGVQLSDLMPSAATIPVIVWKEET